MQLFEHFAAQQRLAEYLTVARRIRQRLGVMTRVIEIGSAAGGTLALWAELSAPDALLVVIDVPIGPEMRYSDDALRGAAAGRRVALIREDSRSPGSRDAIARALESGQADLLFVDGSHHAAAVHSDLRTYAPFVRDGGIVALHDIVVHPGLPDVRVHELWAELRATFPDHVEEILETPDQTWGGIGLLTMTPGVRGYCLEPQRTPVFVNNFNRLSSTRNLAFWIAELARARVIILDNASDWPPLLDWYERCPFEVRRLGANIGHRAAWISGAVAGITTPYYVVSDADLSMDGCPRDVLEQLADGLTRFPWATKAGVGLEIDDIPAEYPSRDLVLGIERQYWAQRLDDRFFQAAVDTTFALYRAGEDPPCAPALRSDRPYIARHLPWYVCPATLDDEERHYLLSANPAFSSGTGHTKEHYPL